MQHAPVAVCSLGSVSGTIEQFGVLSYKGIPYAQPPIGLQRFKAPLPALAWAGTRDGSQSGPMAMQTITPLEHAMGVASRPVSEDCCYLDVWTPDVQGARAVMVWFHGGAFLNGSGSAPVYEGATLCHREDVVVVTCNYRIGALGFLALQSLAGEEFAGSANAGLLDQIEVLKWVNDNITSFGGDPQRVCVFGESAGAISIGAMLSMPETSGLFASAILQSGSPWGVLGMDQAELTTCALLEKMGLTSDQAPLLQYAPSEQILAAQDELVAEHPLAMPFAPVYDGSVITEHPLQKIVEGSSSKIRLLVGTNRDEIKLFRLLFPPLVSVDATTVESSATTLFGAETANTLLAHYPQLLPNYNLSAMWELLLTGMLFHAPAVRLLEAHCANGGEAFSYCFTWQTPAFGGTLGACHGLEIPFVFGNLNKPGVSVLTGDSSTRQELSNAMVAAWGSFARGSSPKSENLPPWSSYCTPRRETMKLDDNSELVSDIFHEQRQLWKEVNPTGVIRVPAHL